MDLSVYTLLRTTWARQTKQFAKFANSLSVIWEASQISSANRTSGSLEFQTTLGDVHPSLNPCRLTDPPLPQPQRTKNCFVTGRARGDATTWREMNRLR